MYYEILVRPRLLHACMHAYVLHSRAPNNRHARRRTAFLVNPPVK